MRLRPIPTVEALSAQPLDPDLTAVGNLATTGLVARTGAGTAAIRSIVVSAGLSVADGDGVAGNPTISPAFAVAGALSTIQAGDAAQAGVGNNEARGDHQHAVETAAPGATGVATAPAAGSSTSLARADHAHQSNTAPANVGTANAIGTAGEPARADHVHAHGAQTDGTLHATATGSVAGFMSAAAVTTLAQLADATFVGSGQTTTAAQTPLTAFTPTDAKVIRVVAEVQGRKSDGTQGACYTLIAAFRRAGATVTQIGVTNALVSQEDDVLWDATLDASGSSVRVLVTGVAVTTIDWAVNARVYYAP